MDASEELKADKQVVLEAVKQDGCSLLFASEELKADKQVVLEAVKQDGRALRFASQELKADKEVILEAVKQDGESLEYASPSLRNGGLKSHLAGLAAAYALPAYTFLSTFLFATRVSATLLDFHEDRLPATTSARFEDESGCALWKLSELGEEGGLAIKREIAAYAGVLCTEFVGVPWSTVIGAARILWVAM